MLPGEGAVSGQMPDFLPGAFRKWVVRAGKERDSLLDRIVISHTTRLHPKQGWSPGEGSTWGADGKALTGLKSGQPFPGTPETEMSTGGTCELQIHQSQTHYQSESAQLQQAWEPGGLNCVQFLFLSSCVT